MQASTGRALLESRGGGESVEVDVDDFDGLSPAQPANANAAPHRWMMMNGWGGQSDAEQHRQAQQ